MRKIIFSTIWFLAVLCLLAAISAFLISDLGVHYVGKGSRTVIAALLMDRYGFYAQMDAGFAKAEADNCAPRIRISERNFENVMSLWSGPIGLGRKVFRDSYKEAMRDAAFLKTTPRQKLLYCRDALISHGPSPSSWTGIEFLETDNPISLDETMKAADK